jgi:hypothetical protein
VPLRSQPPTNMGVRDFPEASIALRIQAGGFSRKPDAAPGFERLQSVRAFGVVRH